jgi:hypothetical protein
MASVMQTIKMVGMVCHILRCAYRRMVGKAKDLRFGSCRVLLLQTMGRQS